MRCALITTVLILSTLFAHAQSRFTPRIAITGDTMIFTDSAYIVPPQVLRTRLLADRKTIADLKALLSQKSANSKSVIVWYEREVAVLRERVATAEARTTAADSLLSLCLTTQTKTGAKIAKRFESVSVELFEIRVRFEQAEIERQKEQVAARKFARKRFWTGVGVGAGAAILGGIILIFAL